MKNKYTIFTDMYSGGYRKLEFDKIAINRPISDAKEIFESIYNIDPDGIACNCCGSNFYIYDSYDVDDCDIIHNIEEEKNG